MYFYLVFFFQSSPNMVLEQQNLSKHLIWIGGKLQTIYSAMLTNVRITRCLTIGLMHFLIHRTIHHFVFINKCQIVLAKRLKATGDFWSLFYVYYSTYDVRVWLYKGAEMIELHCRTMPSIRVISKCYLMLCCTRTSICKITLKHALEILPISLKRPRMLCWSTSKTICKER